MCSNSGEDPWRRGIDHSSVFSDQPTTSYGNLLSLGNFDMILRGTKPAMDMDETSRRRYFSNLSGCLFDHEYQDDQLPGKKRRLTNEQVNFLEKSFEEENKLEPERKNQLAKRLGLPPRQVAVWFQNRRARWKAKQIERDYNLLKSSYDSLLERHELILKENEKLKSEVFNLSERLLGNEMNQEPATNGQPGIWPATARLNAKADDNWSSCTVLSPATDEDYFSDVFRVADRQNRQPNEEPFSWWVWPETSRPLW